MISSRGGAGHRAGRIRPPRRIRITHIERSDDDDIQPTWELLRNALSDIHNRNCSNLSFEQLYRASYTIVIKKKGGLLYQNVKDFEESWFVSHVIPRIEAVVSRSLATINLTEISRASINERRQMGQDFLRGLRDAWEEHKISINMIADILMYLDRNFVSETDLPPIYLASIGLFRDHILRSRLQVCPTLFVFDIFLTVVLEQINMERDGDVIDRNLIRSCVSMLEGLYETDADVETHKLYHTVFEPALVISSEDYYIKECQRLLSGADVSHWLRVAKHRLVEEQERCHTTISPCTVDKLTALIDKQLISRHLIDFLAIDSNGLRWMIDNDKYEDLSTLYMLVTRVDDGKIALANIFSARAVELGVEIDRTLKAVESSSGPLNTEGIGDPSEDRSKKPAQANQQTSAAFKWVEDVLNLKDKFKQILEVCFNMDVDLDNALMKSFRTFINQFSRGSEYLSLYIDDNLKRGIRGKTDAEVDIILDKAITLIRFIQDRDLLETYYHKHLARRLLHANSESFDVEKQMISKMKQEMGSQFTAKFEGMFKDLETSAELTAAYRARTQDTRGDVDLVVSVLNSNFWPSEVMNRPALVDKGQATDNSECTFPPDIKRLQDSFSAFYLKDRSGRKLLWIAPGGTADIRCTFPAIAGKTGLLARERRYELSISTYGMIVLVLFNELPDGGSLSLEELQAETGLPLSDIIRVLLPLSAAPKSAVLLKNPPGKSIKAGDRFSFNVGFVSKTVRIKVPILNSISRVEDTDKRKETEDKNDQMRAITVDAAIVRIMKWVTLDSDACPRQRKELGHAQLVSETITQLQARFKPDVSLVKRRIEDLINREYIERSEEHASPTYRYLA